MPEKISEPKLPRGLGRLLLRAPICIYKVGLGALLGKRFLRLEHTGRKSGLLRQSMLEVVRFDDEAQRCIVASGWGERSDWLKNVTRNPKVTIQVGNHRFKAYAERLSPEEAGRELLDYARRHPMALRELARFMGYRLDGTRADVFALGEILPMVAFTANQQKP